MPVGPNIRKLVIDVSTRAVPGDLGYLGRDLLRYQGFHRDLQAASARTAALAERDAQRAALASTRADKVAVDSAQRRARVLQTLGEKLNASVRAQYLTIQSGEERVIAATERRARIQLQWQQAVAKGNIDAVERYALSWEQADRAVSASAARAAEARIAADARVARSAKTLRDEALAAQLQQERANAQSEAAFAASQRAAAVSQNAAGRATFARNVGIGAKVAGGLGTAALGVGGAAALVGGVTIDQALKWQKFVNQQRSNTTMSTGTANAFTQLSLKLATQYGASPNDIFTALRYGAEKGLSPAQDRRYLRAALALGIPTGGTAAESMQALTTVANNFPNMRGNPRAIGNMVLSASQQSAGITAPQFTEAMPRLLSLASAIGGQNQLPQALALTATLSRAGLPLDQAISQATNIITKIVKPSAGTTKYIGEIDKAKGLNLASDFGSKALSTKGLAGVLNDLSNANLSLGVMEQLFPNMRGLIGARALSGIQNQNFNTVYGNVLASPGKDPLGANLKRYLGLDSTQISKLEQQLKVLAITTGTALLPSFNRLLKDDIVPMVKGLDSLTHSYKAQIDAVIEAAPKIIAVGLGLKALAGGLRLIVSAGDAVKIVKGLAAAMDAEKIAALAATIKTKMLSGVLALDGDASLAGSAETAAGKAKILAGTLALDGDASVAGAAGAAVGSASALTGLSGLAVALADLVPMAAAVVGVLQLAQKSGTDPGAWLKNVAKAFLTSPADIILKHFGIPTLSDIVFGSGGGSSSAIRAAKGGRSAAPMPSNWHPSASLFRLPTSGAGTSTGSYQWNQPLLTPSGVPEGIYLGSGAAHTGRYASSASFHYDIATSLGRAVYLPGTGKDAYKVVGLANHPAGDGDPGYVITFQAANGVVFTLGNLAELAGPGAGMPKTKMNEIMYGGWYVGRTGKGQKGTHLHVVGNAAAKNLFYNVSPHASAPSGAGAGAGAGGGSFGLGKGVPSVVSRFGSSIAASAAKNNIPPNLLASIIYQESTGKPNVVSPTGATGLMQLQPGQGPWGWHPTKNPAQNIAFGSKAFGDLLKQYNGNTFLALEAYYAGPNHTQAYYTANHADDYANAILARYKLYGGKGGGKGPPINYTPPTGTGPKSAYQWAQAWSSKASNLSGPVSAIFGASPDTSTMTATQKATYAKFIVSYLHDEFESEKSYLTAEIKDPTLRAQLIARAARKYANQAKHPFANSPWASGAGKKPTTPMGWSQWYSTQASSQKSLADQQAALWPNANLTDPNGVQRALLTPLISRYYRDTYQSSVSLAHAEYRNNPKLLKEALTSAKTLLNRELAHPFWNYFGTTAAKQQGITPVTLVGNNHQLAVTEKQLRVAEEQLKVLKKLDKNDAMQIKHLQQVIKTLIKELNKLGVHVGFSNGHLTGIVAVGGSGG